MKKLFLLSFFILGISKSFTQTSYSYTNTLFKWNEIIPQSPEVAGLGKFGDIPVGEYTGTPNISIPIYVVKEGNLQLPISLSYHASGIQVSQEATWVGLGWNLIAGGNIAYVPVGGNDQIINLYTPWKNWAKLFNWVATQGLQITNNKNANKYGEDGIRLCASLTTVADSISNTPDEVLLAALNGMGEQDYYSANFLDYSFKFILHPQTKLPTFIGKKNKCLIKVSPYKDFIEVKGPDGIRYSFSAYERDCGDRSFTNWYLTSITNTNGQQIRLHYKKVGPIVQLPILSEKVVINPPTSEGGNKRHIDYLISVPYYQYLSSISSSKDSVVFDTESGRLDVSGAPKLSRIRVLDRINNSIKKTFGFNYDYFTGVLTGGNYLADDTINTTQFNTDLLSKRLKLLSLTQYDTIENSGQQYSFAYNDSISLPYKTSFSKDYWGFYNGEQNASNVMPNKAGHTIIPAILPLYFSKGPDCSYIDTKLCYNIKGACRATSKKYINIGILKSITYPTGGKTVFNFEPHTFGNYRYLSTDDEKSAFFNVRKYVFFNSEPKAVDSFSVKYKSVLATVNATILAITCNGSSYNFDALRNASIIIVNKNTGKTIKTYQLIAGVDDVNFNTTKNKSWTNDTITLTKGSYIIACSCPVQCTSSYDDILSADISFTDINQNVLDSTTSIGGGLRIAEISNYDEKGTKISSTQYKYEGGTLLAPLSLFQVRNLLSPIYTSTGAYCYVLSPDSKSPAASSLIGTNVGYSNVAKIITGNGQNNGFEISRFSNDAALTIYNAAYFIKSQSNGINGDLLQTTVLNQNGDTLKKVKYSYSIPNREDSIQILNTIVVDRLFGYDCLNSIVVNTNRFNIYAYPNESFFSYLSRKEVTDYFGKKKVKSVTDYSYNLNNYEISQQKDSTSDKQIRYKDYKYPSDFLYGIYTQMADTSNYMISNTLVKNEYLNDTLSQNKVITSYSTTNGLILPSALKSQTKSNKPETRLTYDRYDTKGNILQVTDAGGIPISYLWGYKQQMPIAEVKNATYSDVACTSFEDDGSSSNWTISSASRNTDYSKTGTKSYNLSSGTISKSGLTTGKTYTLSYWSRSGSVTVSGASMTTKTGPTINGWNYYEHTLTTTSTSISINGSAIIIDELRLYPVEGQMTTYTYDPLIGVSSSTDINNITTYFIYDSFGRLKLVKDQYGKIIKQNQYHYTGQTFNPINQ
jgi:hypothetical protein